MKIIQYCQHVLGIGHFFRTLEICRALKDHEVILVTGGEKIDLALPSHIREVRLPGLMMNSDFSTLFATQEKASMEEIKAKRQKELWDLFEVERPDLFIVELYPFGRKAFRFELDPVLEGIRNNTLPPCRSVCSLRDILVEKKDAKSYENRVIKTLNNSFDTLLIHSDRSLVTLDETFGRIDDIKIPVHYTGFVTPRPSPGAGKALRQKLAMGPHEKLVVASAGGGKVGGPLMESVATAISNLDTSVRLQMFTGPYMDEDLFSKLEKFSTDRIKISRFTPDFLSWLDAADLSVSMAGYNTSMNIMAARVPSLVWPFAQNREQRFRAERLAGPGAMKLLTEADLEPSKLACIIENCLRQNTTNMHAIDLDGAETTAKLIATTC